jgi:hypothetical protein
MAGNGLAFGDIEFIAAVNGPPPRRATCADWNDCWALPTALLAVQMASIFFMGFLLLNRFAAAPKRTRQD